MFEPFTWHGLPDDLPRTWVRCLRDSLQTPDRQARLIAASGATQVLDIDTDHTPAREDPAALAALLNDLAPARRTSRTAVSAQANVPRPSSSCHHEIGAAAVGGEQLLADVRAGPAPDAPRT